MKQDNKKSFKHIIEEYIDAYNNFDINKMLLNVHEDIKFVNVSNGETTLTTNGIAELKIQADQAKQYFITRKQKIINIVFKGDQVDIDIHFYGKLAKDLPNGIKSGDDIELKGKSIFRFMNNKIIEIQDIS